MRSEADDAWIALGTLDQDANTFTPAGLTNLTQIQAEDDTSTVFGQVSGQRLGQAVAANVPAPTPPTTSEVLSATAGAAVGAVGSYALARIDLAPVNFPFNAGSTVAGSSLKPANTNGGSQAASFSGTWRVMGFADDEYNSTETTLCLRIS